MGKMIKVCRFGMVILLLMQMSGCVAFAPLIKTYSEIGVSREDRVRLLEPRVNDFHQAVYWGKSYEALSLAKEDSRDGLRRHIRSLKKNKRKIVESNIEFVEFDEDAYEAEIEVMVKFYEEPFYVVKDSLEKQTWEFETASGWKFVSRENIGGDSVG